MKKLLLFFALCFFKTTFCQTTASLNDNEFAYLTGSEKINGYSVNVCSEKFPTVKKVIEFKNGRSAPILQIYVLEKKFYIDGVLENELGKKTLIQDITLTENGSSLKFTVIGKEFSCSFLLETGEILLRDIKISTFNTNNVGVWTIRKK